MASGSKVDNTVTKKYDVSDVPGMIAEKTPIRVAEALRMIALAIGDLALAIREHGRKP
jgi:hypothetical protein